MKKIIVVGSGGAGKTTFARKLGRKLTIEVTHLDNFYWKPNWVKTPKEEWKKMLQAMLEKEQWILDGNYKSTLDMRIAAADTVIFLDFSHWTCVWRVVKRRIQQHGTSPSDRTHNKERLTLAFLWWVLTYPRKEMLKIITRTTKNKKVFILKNQRETESFLQSIDASYT